MQEKLYILPNGAGAVKPSAVNSIDQYESGTGFETNYHVRVATVDTIIYLKFESKDQVNKAVRQIAEGLNAILEETTNKIQGTLQEIG